MTQPTKRTAQRATPATPDPKRLKPATTTTASIDPALALALAPPSFATNTGIFLSLPTPTELNTLDYTHISQALAHQPLAINPSRQTIELIGKLSNAGKALERGGEEGGDKEEDRLERFMNEVKMQVS